MLRCGPCSRLQNIVRPTANAGNTVLGVSHVQPSLANTSCPRNGNVTVARIPQQASVTVGSIHGGLASRNYTLSPLSCFSLLSTGGATTLPGSSGFRASLFAGQRLWPQTCTTIMPPPRIHRVFMSLRTGIVGLPNVGKSTLFNALVENGKAQAANFPFCTIEPNVGVVAVPDPRLGVLAEIGKSQKVVGAAVEFVDIAGLVKGASEGEGLGNKFLSHIREVDSIVQVVRCFEDSDIIHVNGKVDPVSDMDTINLELALADLSQIEKRLDRLKKARSKDPKIKAMEEIEQGALERLNVAILEGKAARAVPLSEDEVSVVKQLCLLTMKPIIYAANVAEGDLNDPSSNVHVRAVREFAEREGAETVVVSAQVEAELSELGPDDRQEYLDSLGVSEGGLGSLVRATYALLGLRTYFTCGEKETRAWTINAGMTAPQAAGVIHTDFERGFIRAETIGYEDFVSVRSFSSAREKGLMRAEGRDYVVQEGDVMLFRFNV
eukprot:TRINITY_DN23176_c0_g1_i1.p1 TRINITY_DN23176_c0_g1~~TRINITY_DN23176_c0_g1_i1.p1  ORF type:complete len:494 (+),score=69.32 TRINITY_DN23176_c0_g1_i1:170-1651(+)